MKARTGEAPDFGQWHREQRQRRGLSQMQAAIRHGLHVRTVENWEAGKYPTTVLRALEAFGVRLPFRIENNARVPVPG